MVVLLVAGQLLATPGGEAVAAGTPMVAFATASREHVRVAAGDRTRLARVPYQRGFSLRGDLIATESGPGVVGYDARTGERRFTVRDAALPTVLDPRGRVVFWATYERDRQVNSLWVREIDGRVRRIVQFSNGGDLPGYDTGYEGDAGLLSTSFDAAGAKVALAEGNDVSLFIYDVYVVNVATGRVRRITNDRRSRWPSISPNGRRVAYQREVAECGPDYVRAGRLVVERVDGTGERILSSGSCDAWLSNPRWINDTHVVAYRQRRTTGREFDVDLVLVEAATGVQRALTGSGMVSFFSVDPATGRIAFERLDTDGFNVIDLAGNRTRFARGAFPHMAGEPGTL
jgi:dipeptidyl aminopeptidase/acylaminoacyl peptidase